jgi:hypothetical protein
MVDSPVAHDEGFAAVLAGRARAASDGRLILDVAVGLLVVLATAIWHPRAWIIPLSIGSTLAAYGAWGLIDREIAERSAGGGFVRALGILRGLVVVAGVLSAGVACFAILGFGLGKWKS